DVRQSYGLSKLYNVRQSATCFVVKSSRKAKSVRQLLERTLPARLLPIDGPASLPYLNRRPCQPTIPQPTALPAHLPSIANQRPYLPAIMPTFVSDERTI
ncbi:uncharacterized protein K441DRAFT_668893, partial [Cenococcum geophilum 1.58]|uniref:uncharacterized protein n=1 Tax=Cenococcum geophilum 1.58 TaxID=794803 RepID=UPI00358EB568